MRKDRHMAKLLTGTTILDELDLARPHRAVDRSGGVVGAVGGPDPSPSTRVRSHRPSLHAGHLGAVARRCGGSNEPGTRPVVLAEATRTCR